MLFRSSVWGILYSHASRGNCNRRARAEAAVRGCGKTPARTLTSGPELPRALARLVCWVTWGPAVERPMLLGLPMRFDVARVQQRASDGGLPERGMAG